jgi:hypothetical protein
LTEALQEQGLPLWEGVIGGPGGITEVGLEIPRLLSWCSPYLLMDVREMLAEAGIL